MRMLSRALVALVLSALTLAGLPGAFAAGPSGGVTVIGQRSPTATPALLIGHSFAARGHLMTTNGTLGRQIFKQAYGLPAWAEAMSGGRLRFPYELNFGVNGQTTTDMLTRTDGKNVDAAVAAGVAAGAKAAFFFGINNDVTATGAQVTQTISNIRTIARKVSDAGLTLYITGDFPAGSTTNTTNRRTGNQRDGFNQIRRWILERLPREVPNVVAFDVFDRLAVWNSTNGDVVQTYFDPDALHPWSPFYSEVYVPALLSLILPQFPTAQAVAEASASEPYSATLNPRGNLLMNGMFDGDGGAGLALNWTKTDATGITGTTTKVSFTNGMWQQIAYSGTATAAGAVSDIRQNLNFANIAAGDTLQAECWVEIDAGAVNLRGIELRLVMFDSVGGPNTYEAKSFNWGTAGDKMAVRAFTGANAQFHITPSLPLPAGSLASGTGGYIAIRAVWDAAVASSATVRAGRCRLHKQIAN